MTCVKPVVSIATNLARAQHISADSIFAVDTDPWMASLYALDLGTNVTATCMSSLRLLFGKSGCSRATLS